jgi:predicted heme/steroid binding protein
MKKISLMLLVVLLGITVLVAAKKTEPVVPDKVFTLEELKQYDGTNGKPVYVAVKGIVYDFSKVKAWKTGTHKKMHSAGTDLTKEFTEKAPKFIHKNVLKKMPKVGVLK